MMFIYRLMKLTNQLTTIPRSLRFRDDGAIMNQTESCQLVRHEAVAISRQAKINIDLKECVPATIH